MNSRSSRFEVVMAKKKSPAQGRVASGRKTGGRNSIRSQSHGDQTGPSETDAAGKFVRQWRDARPDLDFSHQGIMLRILRLALHLRRENGETFKKKLKVRGEDVRVLFALRREGPPFRLRPTDLFKSLIVPSATMTRQLDRLVAAGLVSRVSDPNDRRSALVELTPRGLKTADAGMSLLRNDLTTKKAFAQFSTAELTQLDEFLMRLLAQVESSTGLD